MTGDLPDEWFRPPRPEARTPADEAVDEPARARSGAQAGRPPVVDEHPEPLGPTTGSHSVGVEPDEPVEPRPAVHSRTRAVLPVVAGAALLLVAGMGLGQLLDDRDSAAQTEATGTAQPLVGTSTAPSATPSNSSSGTGASPWTGPVRQVRASSVQASCTAAAQPGYDGQMVPSDASRVLDGRLSTGWRCDGTGAGQSLSFTFPKGTRLVGIRMTNGYTKSVDGTPLYPQYRRLATVNWNFPSAWFAQELTDGEQGLQEIRFPPTDASGGLQMQVVQSTAPGVADATRNAVVLTEVEFLAARD